MTETRTLDARGLSCPQPAIMAKQAMKNMESGSIVVIIDSGTARDNIQRIAGMAGWSVEVEERLDDELRLILTR